MNKQELLSLPIGEYPIFLASYQVIQPMLGWLNVLEEDGGKKFGLTLDVSPDGFTSLLAWTEGGELKLGELDVQHIGGDAPFTLEVLRVEWDDELTIRQQIRQGNTLVQEVEWEFRLLIKVPPKEAIEQFARREYQP